MESVVVLNRIDPEELLLRLKKCQAENTLLRKQNSELVQKESANEAYIKEIEQALLKRQASEAHVNNLMSQINNLKEKTDNQTKMLNQLYKQKRNEKSKTN